MPLDLPNRHSPRIHRDDLIVEAGKPPLIALDQLWIERALPIAGDANVDLRRLGQDRLLRIAVPPIPAPFRGLVVEMIVQLGVQNPFRQSLFQLVEQPIS